jgi:hypothetical protein
MTLVEWAATYGYVVREHPGGAYCMPDTSSGHARVLAFHLSDYLVSSVTAGSMWFVPRRTEAS